LHEIPSPLAEPASAAVRHAKCRASSSYWHRRPQQIVFMVFSKHNITARPNTPPNNLFIYSL
jgi:hypothetical protein